MTTENVVYHEVDSYQNLLNIFIPSETATAADLSTADDLLDTLVTEF